MSWCLGGPSIASTGITLFLQAGGTKSWQGRPFCFFSKNNSKDGKICENLETHINFII